MGFTVYLTKISEGMDNVQALTFKGTDLFAGTFYDGIFLSGDKGASWKHIDIGAAHCNVNSIVVSGNNIFAGTAAGVFLSADNGINWTKVNTGLTDTNVTSLAAIGTHLFASTYYNGFFTSEDNGSTWSEINTGITYKFTTRLVSFGNNLIAGTHKGAFLSTNYGAVWTKIEGGLPDEGVYSFAVTGTNIYAAAKRGVYLSSDYGSTWTAFNSVTTIKFSLLNPAHVDLIIYNSMGQEITKLISDYINAGVYLTEWNASEYASGVYYCRILTDSFKETKKLLLMK